MQHRICIKYEPLLKIITTAIADIQFIIVKERRRTLDIV